MFTRRSPRSASARPCRASCVPLVVMARSSNPSAAKRATSIGKALADERLAAGEPDRGHPEAPGHPRHPGDLLEGEELSECGRKVIPSSGMQ